MDNEKALTLLKDWGCDIKGALERMLDDKNMYMSFIMQYKDTFNFTGLKELLKEEKYSEAFELAHDLKGAIGNLGISPLYDRVVIIVNHLRKQDYTEDLVPIADQLLEKKNQLDKILEQCQ